MVHKRYKELFLLPMIGSYLKKEISNSAVASLDISSIDMNLSYPGDQRKTEPKVFALTPSKSVRF